MTDPELERFARFLDRHRAQFSFCIDEEPGLIRARPNGLPMRAITAWIVFIHAVGLGLMAYFKLWRNDPAAFITLLAVMGFEFPTLLALLFALNRTEMAKGPLLEVDEVKRTVVLPRDGQTIPFDGVVAVFVLIGWYNWTSEMRERVAEMSLIVREADDRLVQVAVVLHNEVGRVRDLAERVARLAGKPLEQSKRDRGWTRPDG